MIEELKPQFGISVHPGRERFEETLRLAKIADELGLDLITIMDHPYHRGHLDTWTLLTFLGGATSRVRLATNVANLPLRGPVMLAKMAATLDVLTGGRVELGIGAGASWEGIQALGGPSREPGEAYKSFKEGLQIIRGLWEHAEGSFSYEGEYYQVRGARFGPAPVHRIPLWTGAYGPKMQRLSGQVADGVIVSYSYAKPEELDDFNQRIDSGAEQAGRSPAEIRRGYNVFGTILAPGNPPSLEGVEGDVISGPAEEWSSLLTKFYKDHRQDTLIFWPRGEDPGGQIRSFAEYVVPAVRDAVG